MFDFFCGSKLLWRNINFSYYTAPFKKSKIWNNGCTRDLQMNHKKHTVNREYFIVKIFSDNLACSKIKRTKIHAQLY